MAKDVKPGDRPHGRHPAIVTADRLLDAAAEWGDSLTVAELTALNVAQVALRRVADTEARRERMPPAERLGVAREARHEQAAARDVRRARHALATLDGDCPAPGREVARARIADPSATWAQIAGQLGIKETAAWMRFRRLCAMAEAHSAHGPVNASAEV